MANKYISDDIIKIDIRVSGVSDEVISDNIKIIIYLEEQMNIYV
jgi:hypothetical protein